MEKRPIETLLAELSWDPDAWIPAEDVARVCRLSLDWITTRIEDDVLPARSRGGRYYLTCATVWRVQQIERIERQFDADPQLAALVTDLMEEVRALRQRLHFRDES